MKPITIVKRAAALALITSPLIIGGAQAQIQGNAPIDVSSDEFESLDAQGLAIYRELGDRKGEASALGFLSLL